MASNSSSKFSIVKKICNKYRKAMMSLRVQNQMRWTRTNLWIRENGSHAFAHIHSMSRRRTVNFLCNSLQLHVVCGPMRADCEDVFEMMQNQIQIHRSLQRHSG